MSKERTSYNSISGDYDQEKLTDIHSSKTEASAAENIKDTYLPHTTANYRPSEESIERANHLDSSNPNPVKESIVTNNG